MGVVSDITTTIDGITYTTKTFPATEGLTLLPKIIDLFGEKIIALFVKVDDDGAAEQLLTNPKVVAALILDMGRRASESEDGWLVLKRVMRYVETDQLKIGEAKGKGSVYDHFDDHFAADYPHMLKVAMWATMAGFRGP